MKNNILTRLSRFVTLVVIVIIAAALCSPVYVSAEIHSSETNAIDDFKVGDRVEVTTVGLLEDRYYVPCVITEVLSNGYMVECPSENNMKTFVQKGWVRAIKKAVPVKEPEPIKPPDPVKEPEPIKEPVKGENDLTDEQLFEKYDANKSGWLSGKELTACDCIEFDTNGDYEVTKAEFLAGMQKKHGIKPPNPPGSGAKINGSWKGTYTCVQGLTNLVLSLYSQDGNNVEGIFTFHLGDGENMTFLGSFKMTGTYDQKTGSLYLKGVDWNQKPADYLIADLSGTVSQSGLSISGNVTKPTGCGMFKVERIKF